MIWPFRKRKPVHVGPTSVDWKPGDMAECVDGEWYPMHPADPKLGERLMVSDVRYGATRNGQYLKFWLIFIGKPEAYQAASFRKIILTDTGADRKVEKRRPLEVGSHYRDPIHPVSASRDLAQGGLVESVGQVIRRLVNLIIVQRPARSLFKQVAADVDVPVVEVNVGQRVAAVRFPADHRAPLSCGNAREAEAAA